jgi:hypothetical protein
MNGHMMWDLVPRDRRPGARLPPDRRGSRDGTPSALPDIAKINSPADRRSPMKIMKMRSYARIAILFAMAVAAPAHAASHTAADRDDRYVRNVTEIADDNGFRAHDTRWRRPFPGFDWRTDGCSGPARLTGYADNVHGPWVQPDVGDRHDGRAHCHHATRAFIDDELLSHARQRCAHDAVPAEAGCDLAAGNSYPAVRAFGTSAR